MVCGFKLYCLGKLFTFSLSVVKIYSKWAELLSYIASSKFFSAKALLPWAFRASAMAFQLTVENFEVRGSTDLRVMKEKNPLLFAIWQLQNNSILSENMMEATRYFVLGKVPWSNGWNNVYPVFRLTYSVRIIYVGMYTIRVTWLHLSSTMADFLVSNPAACLKRAVWNYPRKNSGWLTRKGEKRGCCQVQRVKNPEAAST